jgi:hypothetical protein
LVDREGNILVEDKIKTPEYEEIEVFIAPCMKR